MDCYKIIATNLEDSNVILQTESLVEAIRQVDKILSAVARFDLLTELNELQQDCSFGPGDNKLPDKYNMPLRIYNYILDRFNLAIREIR